MERLVLCTGGLSDQRSDNPTNNLCLKPNMKVLFCPSLIVRLGRKDTRP